MKLFDPWYILSKCFLVLNDLSISRFNAKISHLITMGQCFRYLNELDSWTDTSKEKQFSFFNYKKGIVSNSEDKTTDFLPTFKPCLPKGLASRAAPVPGCKSTQLQPDSPSRTSPETGPGEASGPSEKRDLKSTRRF